MVTRDECLQAISEAFDGVKVEAIVGDWNVRVESVSVRQLLLTNTFVAKHVDGAGMTPEQLSATIKAIPHSGWVRNENGVSENRSCRAIQAVIGDAGPMPGLRR
jgi:hypothetical protein